MNKRHLRNYLIAILATLAILVFLSLDIFLNLRIKYLWKPISYQEAYFLKDFGLIKSMDQKGDSLEIGYSLFKGDQIKKRVYFPDLNRNERKLIKLSPSDSILLEKQPNNHIHILHSTLPTSIVSSYSGDDFYGDLGLNESERIEIKTIIKSWNYDSSSSDLERISWICANLIMDLKEDGKHYKFNPSNASALKLYQEGKAGNTKLDCNEYSHILFPFLNLAGIPTRRVALSGEFYSNSIERVKQTGHHFCEAYVRGLRKWVYIDLSSGKIFVKADNKYLNTVEYWTNVNLGLDNILSFVTVTDSGEIKEKKLAENDKIEKWFFSPNDVILFKLKGDRFTFGNRLERLILNPEPAMNTSSELNLSYKNWVIFFWALWFLSVVIIGFSSLKNVVKSPK